MQAGRALGVIIRAVKTLTTADEYGLEHDSDNQRDWNELVMGIQDIAHLCAALTIRLRSHTTEVRFPFGTAVFSRSTLHEVHDMEHIGDAIRSVAGLDGKGEDRWRCLGSTLF